MNRISYDVYFLHLSHSSNLKLNVTLISQSYPFGIYKMRKNNYNTHLHKGKTTNITHSKLWFLYIDHMNKPIPFTYYP